MKKESKKGMSLSINSLLSNTYMISCTLSYNHFYYPSSYHYLVCLFPLLTTEEEKKKNQATKIDKEKGTELYNEIKKMMTLASAAVRKAASQGISGSRKESGSITENGIGNGVVGRKPVKKAAPDVSKEMAPTMSKRQTEDINKRLRTLNDQIMSAKKRFNVSIKRVYDYENCGNKWEIIRGDNTGELSPMGDALESALRQLDKLRSMVEIGHVESKVDIVRDNCNNNRTTYVQEKRENIKKQLLSMDQAISALNLAKPAKGQTKSFLSFLTCC